MRQKKVLEKRPEVSSYTCIGSKKKKKKTGRRCAKKNPKLSSFFPGGISWMKRGGEAAVAVEGVSVATTTIGARDARR